MREGDLIVHSNRVFAVKFSNKDPNVLASGGWDNNVIVWDCRTAKAAMLIAGPLICGESLDIDGSLLLTGSWRETDHLQFWDLRNCRSPLKTWLFESHSTEKFQIYSAMISRSPEKRYIAVGTSGHNAIKLFDYQGEGIETKLGIRNIRGGVLSLDMTRDNQMLACAGSNGLLKIYDILV
eukprot:TRINITY_DN3364_c0_g1_i4.p1 TRINITY_DN3364_c0_g1~~TRINITY_DN3364_c0_g1_i4.p1  ORF type:complete len:180 (+),score=29.43 TRINITY_DN3364_c0_g1_i4:835-1374(+)